MSFQNHEILNVQRVFYFFKVVGLATIKIDLESNEKKFVRDLQFTHSRCGIVYNLLLSCLIIVLNCFSIYFGYKVNFMSRGAFEITINIIETIFTIFTSIFILTVNCIQQEKIIDIANRMKILTCLSMSLNRKLCYKKTLFSCNIKRIWIINITTTLLVLLTSSVINKEIRIYHIAIYPCFLIISLTIIQYSIILKLLNELFKILNASFFYIASVSVSPEEIFSTQTSDKNFNDLLVIADALPDLQDAYLSLCKLSTDLSNFYSLISLFCISNIFVTLILFSYFIAIPMVNGIMSLALITGYIHSLFYVLHFITLLVILTKCVQAVTLEVMNGLIKSMY